MRVTPEEATLAAGIAQGLIARGDFGKGAFDKVFPEGFKAGEPVRWDEDAMAGVASVATMALMLARQAIRIAEAGRPEPGEEWKGGTDGA